MGKSAVSDRYPSVLAHVLGQLDFGGVETMAGRLIRHMPGRGLEHLVIVTGRVDPARLDWLEAQAPVEVYRCPYVPGRRLSFVRRLARAIEARRPAAVLAYSFGNHAMVSLACHMAGVRQVYVRVAGSPLRSLGARLKNGLIAHLARPFCAGEIAVSRALARELTRGIGLPEKRVQVITNGCVVDAPMRTAPAPDGGNPGKARKIRLLMVSRMDDAKDQASAIRAVAELTAAGREACLSLVGDGPKRAELETLARQEGLAARVRFHGNRTDVADLMRRHDLMLHCTFSEGFPNVIIEAMAVGLPVIASDIPPCREVLDDGSCGILTPTRDPRAVSAAIIRLMDGPELRRQQAARARALVDRLYRIEDCAGRYAELLMPDTLK